MGTQPQATLQVGAFKPPRWIAYLLRIILIALLVWIVYRYPPLANWPLWVAAAGWVAFSLYWGAAAKNSAPTQRSESVQSRRVHELLINLGILLLFIPVPGLRQSFLPVSPAWIPLGLAIEFSSVALAVWSRRRLGRNWSGRIEIKADHELVRSGPYRVLRHPIYVAILGMCVGTALVDGQAHALVALAIVVFAYWRKVRMEEANLRQAFGVQYDDYLRATWF